MVAVLVQCSAVQARVDNRVTQTHAMCVYLKMTNSHRDQDFGAQAETMSCL